ANDYLRRAVTFMIGKEPIDEFALGRDRLTIDGNDFVPFLQAALGNDACIRHIGNRQAVGHTAEPKTKVARTNARGDEFTSSPPNIPPRLTNRTAVVADRVAGLFAAIARRLPVVAGRITTAFTSI